MQSTTTKKVQAEDEAANKDTPTKLNDAVMLGKETLACNALLETPVTLMTGKVYGLNDRKNTPDGGWNPVTRTWSEWIQGTASKGLTSAEGFSRHPVAKEKEGQCIVFADSATNSRKKEEIGSVYAIGKDIDGGEVLSEVVGKILSLNLFAMVYTTYNHGTTELQLKRDEVIRKLALTDEPTLDDVKEYLRVHDTHEYRDSFIDSVQIVDGKKQVKGGVKIILSTPPQEKFRLVFPLLTPVRIADLAFKHTDGLAIYESKVIGLARNILGITFDKSCVDPGRVFFTPRHKKGQESYSAIIQGNPLVFADIPEMKATDYAKERAMAGLNIWEQGGYTDRGDGPPVCVTPSGKSLNDWHTRYKERFQIVTAIEHHSPNYIRSGGGGDSATIQCPFEGSHSVEGGSGTMAVNPVENNHGVWTAYCHHDSCRDRHKLEMLSEMLAQNYFPESVLTDKENGYVLVGNDEEYDEEEEEDADEVIEPEQSGGKSKSTKVSASQLKKRFRKLIREESTKSQRFDAERDAVADSGFSATKVGVIWAEVLAEESKEEAEAEAEKRANAPRSEYLPIKDATAETVRKAAENAKWLPSFVRYRKGWFEAQVKIDGEFVWKRLCRAFEVPYITYGETAEGRSTDIIIRYPHRSKQRGIVESVYKIGDTYRDSGAFLSRLVDAGLEIDAAADIGALVRLFKAVDTSSEAQLVEKAGWYGETYMAPTGRAVNAGAHRFILNPLVKVNDAQRGTLASHHTAATTALTGLNGRYFLPGYLSGLVGCLVNFIANESSILMALEGPSTLGKTSGAKAGAAHYTIPNDSGLFHKADTTANAAEIMAVKGNGAVVALDDEGASKTTPEEKQRLLLQWGDGTGRNRAKQDGGIRETKTWCTCFVTSTEVGFINQMVAADADIKTGAVSRVFSVNFDGASRLAADSDELAAIRVLTNYENAGVYGVTGPLFAEKLAGLGRDAVKARVSAVETEWVGLAVGAGARVVRAAAIIAVAGEIAQEAGIFSDEVKVRVMVRGLLVDTLDARTAHLDTDKQGLITLRRSIIRGIQTGDVVTVHEEREINRSEILGYYGHFGDNGKPSDKLANVQQSAEAEMRKRTYILPVERLGKLGNTTDPKSLADKVRAVGGLIERKKGDRLQWWHDTMPGESSDAKNIRVSGLFVHGEIEIDGVQQDVVVPMRKAA